MRAASLWLARVLVVLPVLLLQPVVDAAPAPAPALTPSAAAATLEVELTELGGGVSHVIRIGIAVDPQGGVSELKTRIDDAYYRIQVRALVPSGSYAFEIERAGSDRTRDLKMSATRALTAGHKGLLGRVARADGSRTEISATLR